MLSSLFRPATLTAFLLVEWHSWASADARGTRSGTDDNLHIPSSVKKQPLTNRASVVVRGQRSDARHSRLVRRAQWAVSPRYGSCHTRARRDVVNLNVEFDLASRQQPVPPVICRPSCRATASAERMKYFAAPQIVWIFSNGIKARCY